MPQPVTHVSKPVGKVFAVPPQQVTKGSDPSRIKPLLCRRSHPPDQAHGAVAQKRDGKQRTNVRVTSGQVELEAGDKKVLLAAGVEGVVEEGAQPLRRSLTPEIIKRNLERR